MMLSPFNATALELTTNQETIFDGRLVVAL